MYIFSPKPVSVSDTAWFVVVAVANLGTILAGTHDKVGVTHRAKIARINLCILGNANQSSLLDLVGLLVFSFMDGHQTI
jgi:hypothetical protein